uniref:Uncharacterized protein n=1 Tax=Aegilops tauschii subsp. strangulata TaxID=200361 RepID=A0A453J4M8_AEGTS
RDLLRTISCRAPDSMACLGLLAGIFKVEGSFIPFQCALEIFCRLKCSCQRI